MNSKLFSIPKPISSNESNSFLPSCGLRGVDWRRFWANDIGLQYSSEWNLRAVVPGEFWLGGRYSFLIPLSDTFDVLVSADFLSNDFPPESDIFRDISGNSGVTSGLSVLASIPDLVTLYANGTGLNGPTVEFSSTLHCTLPSTVCGSPGCIQTTPIPACPTSTVAGDNNPADFTAPTASTVLWILLGAFGFVLLVLTLTCVACNQRGAVAHRLLVSQQSVYQENLVDKFATNQQQQQQQTYPNYPNEPSNNEMAMITLSRNGIPKRTFSLPETRKLQSKEEAAMDVSARDPFVVANNSAESFPVRRPYAKELGDELSLTEGDSVVLTKVFRDGWAEGVSMRAGGPALFPLACLGGGVPVVLAERLRVARLMATRGPPVGFVERNRILEETFRERFSRLDEPEKLYLSLHDFDGVSYSVETKDSKSVLYFSMNMRCYPELRAYGADNVLYREYGSLLQATAEPGFDVTLRIDQEQLRSVDTESLVKKLALLKRNALAAPFEVAFQAQAEGKQTEVMTVNYRDREAIYVMGFPDRVTVIFSTQFKEEADQIYGRVFLQEFVDARRQPSIQNAPQVLYSPREPPLEIRGLRLPDADNIGYVTFDVVFFRFLRIIMIPYFTRITVLFPRHFTPGPIREETISRIQLFRDYLHYHIKASKAYMHSRMRARVESFLKVLNRAKPEKPEDQKEKKTITGKTFKH
ncbi:hypothetical protein HK100_007691 [Physocladia obscura]|uniref:SH3 domain-containing protein n=1 Tax=Physocladia obscura TaxID=109957 RepID=A0AAD5SUP0_9FUNG|nr:hypothetical protein HK100_007691 [Physocladia obscura]